MSGTKKDATPVGLVASSEEEWQNYLSQPGLRVFDVYTKWAGPCDAMLPIFKRFKTEFGENVTFCQAQSEVIEDLSEFRNKSCPTFLFYFDGVPVKIVQGANAPLIEKTIKEQIQLEKDGQPHVAIKVGSGRHPTSSRGRTAPKMDAEENSSSGPLQKTLAIIKPDAMNPTAIEQILEIVRRNRFEIVEKKKIWMSKELVSEFYSEHVGQPFFPALLAYLSAAPVLAMVLSRDNCIAEWRAQMGPPNSKRARDDAPKSIRAILGTDARLNAIFGSATESAAEREIELLLGPESKALVMPLQESQLSGTTAAPLKTVAVIKPDLVQAGKVDQIVEKILCRGYTIVAREEVVLNTETASELYDYWKDEPFFAELVSFMTSGPAVALVIKGEDVIGGWLEMMGNNDPEIAKNEAPSSLRAIYGTDTIHNAVHGSNSPEDAIHEIQLLFPRVIKKSSRTGSINFGTRPSSGLKALIGTEPNAADVAGRLENISNKTLALIKPDAYGSGKKDDILARVKEAGFNVLLEAEIQFSEERAGEFYKEHAEKPFYKDLTTWMSSAPIYAMVLEKADAIPGWRELAGPTNSEKAREAAPQSIRALFGTDGTKNAVHGSDSPASAEREIKLVFGEAGAKLFVIEPVAKSLSKVPSKAASVAELTKTVSSPAVNKGSVEVLPKAPSAGTAINKTTSRDSVNKNAVAASTKSLNKAPSASAVNKTKTASGNSLNKNASGSAINKTGSRASIAKNPSGTSLNKGGSADKVAKSPSKPGSKQGSKEKIGPEPIPEAQ